VTSAANPRAIDAVTASHLAVRDEPLKRAKAGVATPALATTNALGKEQSCTNPILPNPASG
jgi:hypothetical protein